MAIHPTAVIDKKAEVDNSAVVGPCAVIDAGVRLGAHCVIGPHVYLTGDTEIGPENTFHAGCVIGDAPQDVSYKGARTGLEIGKGNTFREHVTIHRSNKLPEKTKVGSHNLLMAGAHVGHNCLIGNHVIIANGALLGGHVIVQDRAFISGTCLLHQFARVGALAFMQGGAGISQDLPPFTVASGNNRVCGLNTIGLRRAGVSSEERLELKRLYRLFFLQGLTLSSALKEAQTQTWGPKARQFIEFIKEAKRGVCRHGGEVNAQE